MAVPVGIAPKVVTFGGFKRRGTLFRVAGIGGPKGTQRVAPNATQSPNQRVEAKAFRFLSRRVSRRVLAGPKGTFPLDKGKGGGKEMEARDRGLLPTAKGATPAKGEGMRISGAAAAKPKAKQMPSPLGCRPLHPPQECGFRLGFGFLDLTGPMCLHGCQQMLPAESRQQIQ